MMVNTNKNWHEYSDLAIIEDIGRFIKKTRQNQNLTQAQLSERAGLNRWTISQIENGEAIHLTSLIQMLRALNSLHVLDGFEVTDPISPIEYAKLKKKERQRVRNASSIAADKDELKW